MTSVLVTAPIPQSALDILTQAGLEVESYSGDGLITKEDLLRRIVGKDYLITPLATQVDRDVIDADPNLKLIANYGVGFNNIDAAYARTKGIPVTNTPKVSTTSTAEVTTGLIITLAHRMVEGDRLMRTKGFAGWSPLFFLGHELAGKTLELKADTEVSVTLMNNDEIQKINEQYRGVDRPTDVISFAMHDDDEDDLIVMDPEMAAELPLNLGDIMISVDKVAEQAEFLQHSPARELGYLVVHGFLHLNGYDHLTPADETEMFGLQRQILDAYGLKK